MKKESGVNMTANTSAHVHVGIGEIGKDYDVFDLLIMSELIDENAIIRSEPEGGRNYSKWAELRSQASNILDAYGIGDGGEDFAVISNDDFLKALERKDKGVRYRGFNIFSLIKQPTVEFRYFSSRMAENPELYIKWIDYFLQLPTIAKKRNKIKIGNYYINRLSGNRFFVSRFGYYSDRKHGVHVNEKDNSLLNVAKKLLKKQNLSGLSDPEKLAVKSFMNNRYKGEEPKLPKDLESDISKEREAEKRKRDREEAIELLKQLNLD
jgi:hypothetical protein